MDFEVQDVVNYLGSKIGSLQVEMAMMTAQNKKMEEKYNLLLEEDRLVREENTRLREMQNLTQPND